MRLVYLSPVPWASFAQRPHKFVEWFQKKNNCEVLWVDPYPTRIPALADYRCSRNKQAHVQMDVIPSWLTVFRPLSLPIEPLPGGGAINKWLLWGGVLRKIDEFVNEADCYIGIGKPSQLALVVLERHPTRFSFYDAMDDFPAFYSGVSRRSMEVRESKIAKQVTRIFVSSTALSKRFAQFHLKCTTVMNACETETIANLQKNEQSRLRPVLGYIGTIGHWFDWPLISDLAKANPGMIIRLIGPMYVVPAATLPGNIDILPACSHNQAMLHMKEFDVGLIPFKKNDLTASVDPIKYYEYRSLGIPVLSTDFGEMSLRDKSPGVFLVGEKSNASELVNRALAFKDDLASIRTFQKENSWSERFEKSRIFSKVGRS